MQSHTSFRGPDFLRVVPFSHLPIQCDFLPALQFQPRHGSVDVGNESNSSTATALFLSQELCKISWLENWPYLYNVFR